MRLANTVMLGRVLMIGFLAAAPAQAAKPYRAPRTSFGQPSLDGGWTNSTFTTLQRPKSFKALLATPADAAAYVNQVRNTLAGIANPPGGDTPKPDPATAPTADVGQAQGEWFEMPGGLLQIDGSLRTSIIIDPADGKLPYSAAGRTLVEAAARADASDFSGPEARMADERCLLGQDGAAGPPMLPPGYNAHYRIVQTRADIAIFSEMIHDVRIVHLGGTHSAVTGHPWLGDSIGRWEGETLVIETIDQNPGGGFRFLADGILYISPDARVTERLTRISPTQIRYAFEVEDSSAYTKPWTGELVFNASKGPTFEYACHEGNYALPNILAGARAQEREAAPPKSR